MVKRCWNRRPLLALTGKMGERIDEPVERHFHYFTDEMEMQAGGRLPEKRVPTAKAILEMGSTQMSVPEALRRRALSSGGFWSFVPEGSVDGAGVSR